MSAQNSLVSPDCIPSLLQSQLQLPSDMEEDPKTEEDPEPTLTPIPTEPTEPTNPEPTEIEIILGMHKSNTYH